MLIEAAKGGHTNVVSYLLDYPNNILSVPPTDLSQLTPPSQDASQVYTALCLTKFCIKKVLLFSRHSRVPLAKCDIILFYQVPRVPFQALAMVVPPQEPDRAPSSIATPPPISSKGK